jgi:hypothetical protein
MRWTRNLIASAVSVVPFAATQTVRIVTYRGAIVDVSKADAALIVLFLSLMLLLACASVLAFSEFAVGRLRLTGSLFSVVAIAALLALATLADPGFWSRLSSPSVTYGPAPWMIASGLLAILLFVMPWVRRNQV